MCWPLVLKVLTSPIVKTIAATAVPLIVEALVDEQPKKPKPRRRKR